MTDNAVTITRQQIEDGIHNLTSEALAIAVTDAESCRLAKEHFSIISQMEKTIEAFFEPLVKKAHEAHKALTTARTNELAKLRPGKEHINRQVVAWETAEEKRRREKEAELLEAARKAAEEEQIQAAIEAETYGDTQTAEAILEEAPMFAAPIVKSEAPKVTGTAIRSTWKAEIQNEMAIIKGVAEGKIPRQAVIINEAFFNNQARISKGTIQYPGVRMYEDKKLTGARR